MIITFSCLTANFSFTLEERLLVIVHLAKVLIDTILMIFLALATTDNCHSITTSVRITVTIKTVELGYRVGKQTLTRIVKSKLNGKSIVDRIHVKSRRIVATVHVKRTLIDLFECDHDLQSQLP